MEYINIHEFRRNCKREDGDVNVGDNFKKIIDCFNVSTFVERLLKPTFEKAIKAYCKLFYLKNSLKMNLIPYHILKNLKNIDNLFYKDYLINYKQKMQSKHIALNILKDEINQTYWLINRIFRYIDFVITRNPINEGDKFKVNFRRIILNKANQRYIKFTHKIRRDELHNSNRLKNRNRLKLPLFLENAHNNSNINLHTDDWLQNNYNDLHKKGRILNLTKLQIPINILNLLSLGEKFCFTTHNNKKSLHKDILNMIIDIEKVFINLKTSENHINITRSNIINEISNYLDRNNKNMKNKQSLTLNNNRTFSIFHNTVIKDMIFLKRFLTQHKDIVIIKTDKTKQIAFLYKSEYNDKMKELLNDIDTYKTSRLDPGPNLVNRINDYLKILEKKGFITKQQKLRLSPNHYVTPRIHGLLKAHKDNNPLRPIINNINGPTNALSIFLNKSLNNLNDENHYDVKNAFMLKKRLDELEIENYEDIDIVSFDAKSLFTNIPLKLMLKIIDENWNKIENFTCIKDKKIFLDGIKLCTHNSYFKFNNTFYKQIYGLPMGSNLSVNLSGIVMNSLLDTQLNDTFIKPFLITKYIDDLLIILPKNQYKQLLVKFNEYNPRLQFTVETLHNEQIAYLDMNITINKEHNKIYTSWYKKDISSNRTLHYLSNHPRTQIINTINNLIRRAINLTDDIYMKEIKTKIYNILLENAYPRTLINNIWYNNYNKVKQSIPINTQQSNIDNVEQRSNLNGDQIIAKMRPSKHNNASIDNKNKGVTQTQTKITDYLPHTETLYQNDSNELDVRSVADRDKISKFYKIKYIPTITNKIKAIFKKYEFQEIKLAQYNNNKLTNILSNMKDKIDKTDRINTIYQLECNNCNKVYIGESKQQLHNRIKQHKYDTNQHKIINKTALCQHAIKNRHKFNFDTPKVLTTEGDTFNRKNIEAIYITKNINRTHC
ncbi:putative autophagy-related protein 11 isoform X2 [Onthophagus taurus]|uniref:putative autophagy-related protein 11 isoform X2 n=2 Tax=Onthophagus taurus TaxID=166361 RepID=UPI0039BE4FAB